MQLKWGVHGCGKIASDFVHAMQVLPKGEHKVTAVMSGSASRAQQFIDTHPIAQGAHAHTDQAQFLADPNIDVVYIAGFNSHHHAHAMAALTAGKNVLCEKPLGMNPTEVKQMIDCAHKHKVFFMEAFWSRCFPVYHELRKVLDRKQVGEARSIVAEFGIGQIADAQVNRLDQVDLGGSMLMDIGCYLVQFTQFVFKEAPIKIHATKGRMFNSGVDNSGSVVLEFADHRLSTLHWTADAHSPTRATVNCTQGYIQLDTPFYASTNLKVVKSHGNYNNEVIHELNAPLPTSQAAFNYGYSCGLNYEAAHVRDCIIKGVKQSDLVTHADSSQMSDTLFQIRQQIHGK